ncbi:hypothetical protein GQ473_07340 [archaeon]|nr:hypothetical protein [archaeon]
MLKKDTIKVDVLKYIKKHKSVTTYQIAKGCEVSWSSANIKCLILSAEGVIESIETVEGMNKTHTWSIKGAKG